MPPRVRRVLIVDDHDEIRTFVARLVRIWGHQVAVANDATGALSLVESFEPDCVVMDLSLPGMSGIELARHLRQRFPRSELYLIALTGYPGADIRDACLEAGFDAHLVKPALSTQLKKLLESNEHSVQ